MFFISSTYGTHNFSHFTKKWPTSRLLRSRKVNLVPSPSQTGHVISRLLRLMKNRQQPVSELDAGFQLD